MRRFSKSPRYLVPESKEPISRAYTGVSFKISGTAPSLILAAKPSTIAVLPTPGSPTSRGLFFFLRHNTCITRFTSSARPINGSICFCLARAIKSRVYFARAFSCCSFRLCSLCCGALIAVTSSTINSLSTPCCNNRETQKALLSSIIAIKRSNTLASDFPALLTCNIIDSTTRESATVSNGS